ncbi:hypothetical protein FM120_31145 [Sphingobacterium faecium PCAi_F2.5]|nr:hypothetical protein FM120_31145 [Sphingobacterium faecium PCAi_F2.5]
MLTQTEQQFDLFFSSFSVIMFISKNRLLKLAIFTDKHIK